MHPPLHLLCTLSPPSPLPSPHPHPALTAPPPPSLQARGHRLGAMQRKFPSLGIALLYVLAVVELLAFPLLGAGALDTVQACSPPPLTLIQSLPSNCAANSVAFFASLV